MSGPGYLICDDWLPVDALERLREFLGSHRYFSVRKDGARGPGGTLEQLAAPLEAGELRLLGGKFVALRIVPEQTGSQIPYPSGTPLDAVIEQVQATLPELAAYLGNPGEHWDRLGVGPRLYPRGGELADHDDSDSFGTFAVYAHSQWLDEWGGELSIGGNLIKPLPNRCVFVKGGTPHRVLPVLETAGIHLRMSVIGYTRRQKAKKTGKG